MNRHRFFLVALIGSSLACLVGASAVAADTIRVGVYSENESHAHASAGARIAATRYQPGARARSASAADARGRPATIRISSRAGAGPIYPRLAPDSPLLRNPEPFGQGTFWYTDGGVHACIYVADSSPACYTMSSLNAGPAVDPSAIASTLAARIDLTPGTIRTSPTPSGLTGAGSWFWLEPVLHARILSVALAGESVTVTAEPSVRWRFGDASGLDGGSGRPYEPGRPPLDAIVHAYQTRCLQGDRGRNPYVLRSCGAAGYRVVALVLWRVTYRASGPVDVSGVLPTRTTEADLAYQVSEARAFLVAGAAP